MSGVSQLTGAPLRMANTVCTPEASTVSHTSTSQADELEYLSSATLTKRKDFLDREEEARGAPNRVLYYRRNADHVKLIAACTKTLEVNPKSVRALLLRGSSFIKQGEQSSKTECYSCALLILMHELLTAKPER